MWTQRDQFSNKQLTFIDNHLNIRLYKQRLSNQPHMQQGVFKVHLTANSPRSNRVSSQSQLCTSSYHVKFFKVPSDLADSIQIRRPYDTDDVDDEDE